MVLHLISKRAKKQILTISFESNQQQRVTKQITMAAAAAAATESTIINPSGPN